MQDYINKNQ